MSRVQLALNVPNLDEAVAFYSKLFGPSRPSGSPGYANFAIADPPLKLVLFEKAGAAATLNHLGVEVFSSDEVAATPGPPHRRRPATTARRTAHVASPCRTRSGSTVPTAAVGDLHRARATPRLRPAICAPSTTRATACAARQRPRPAARCC